MIRKLKEASIYYKHMLINIILIVGLLLSGIGSWQVYYPVFGLSIKLISIIPYSIIKLFAFVPTESLTKSLPLAYELAAWICPFGTVIGFFSFFSGLWGRIRLVLTYKNRDTYLVMGWNDDSKIFIKHIQKEYKKAFVYCVIPMKNEFEQKDEISHEGVGVLPLIYEEPMHLANKKFIGKLPRGKIKAIICFEQEPECYVHIETIAHLLESSRHNNVIIDVWLSSFNEEIRTIISTELDSCDNISMHYFNTNELMAIGLITKNNFPIHRTSRYDETWCVTDIVSRKSISDKIGKVHLLIVGFSDIGQQMMNIAINQCNVNLDEKLTLTILDKDASRLLSIYEGKVSSLYDICNINVINRGLIYKQTKEDLEIIAKTNPFTSIIYTINDAETSLLSVERFREFYRRVPIAIFCVNELDYSTLISPIKKNNPNIVIYGNKSNVLMPSNVFNEPVYREAKRFNKSYTNYASNLLGWDIKDDSMEDMWRSLNALHKESTLYQALHRVVKLNLINNVVEAMDTSIDEASTLLNGWREELLELDAEAQVDYIESHIIINYITALEHKRWCSFYYRKGYRYAEVKDDVKKQHNCLIDDWDKFLQCRRDKVVYDFLSTLVID